MRININTTTGFYAEGAGDGIQLNGLDAKQYPFKDLWDDLQGTLHGASGTGGAALTYEQYRDTGFNLYFFRHNQDDELSIIYQMPHSWNPTTDVWPHVHLIPMGAGSGDAYFSVLYAWVPVNNILGPISTWTSTNATISFVAGDQYKHRVVGLGNIAPPANAGPSTMFLIKITRLGTNLLDTYTADKPDGTAAANVGIIFADLHHQKISAGTTGQYYNV